MSQIPPIYGEQSSFTKPAVVNGLEYSPGSVYQPAQEGSGTGALIAKVIGGLLLVGVLMIGGLIFSFRALASWDAARVREQQAREQQFVLDQVALEQELVLKREQAAERAKRQLEQQAAIRRKLQEVYNDAVKKMEEARAKEVAAQPTRTPLGRTTPTSAPQRAPAETSADKMVKKMLAENEARQREMRARHDAIRTQTNRVFEESDKRIKESQERADKLMEETRRSVGGPSIPGFPRSLPPPPPLPSPPRW